MPTPDHHAGRPGVPAPPGGHALWIDPDAVREAPASTAPGCPVAEEFSAGGVVIDHTRADLPAAIIARRTRGGRLEWCLPKGHLEGEETAEEAAVREVREETGILGRIREHVGTIDYWFSGDEHRVHKVVHHYLLTAIGGRLTVEEDPDHEAEDAAWVPIEELGARLAHPNERRIAYAAHDLLTGRRASHAGRVPAGPSANDA